MVRGKRTPSRLFTFIEEEVLVFKTKQLVITSLHIALCLILPMAFHATKYEVAETDDPDP